MASRARVSTYGWCFGERIASTAWSRLRIPVEAHSHAGVDIVISGSRNMSLGTRRRSRTPVFRFSFSSVIPAEYENSAAERVVGTAM